jgi:hemolysin III
MKFREQTPVEEFANVVTHGCGLLLSLVGLALLLPPALRSGSGWHILGCSVFGTTLVMMYAASTLYHGIQAPRLKALFRALDHCCIFLLIAGTYTPFTLVNLRHNWGPLLCGIVWGLALTGILARLLSARNIQIALTLAYLLMGWLALIAIKPLMAAVPFACVVWIFGGGAFYTIGVIFFSLDRLRFHHTIWHLFVLGGSICHFLAVFFYVLPDRS